MVRAERLIDERQSAGLRFARWMLIGLLMAGVVAMHVLSEHDADRHGPLDVGPWAAGASVVADHSVVMSPGAFAVDQVSTFEHSMLAGGHPDDSVNMVTCVLFLVVGAAMVALILLAIWSARRRACSPGGRSGVAVAGRGPPRTAVSSVFSLCVLRV